MTGLLLCLAIGTTPLQGIAPVAAHPTGPDMIVFRSTREIFDGNLYRMDHNGGHVQRLTWTRGVERMVAVNPQGTLIAFFREVPFGLGTTGLYIVRSDGTGEKLLLPTKDSGSIAFSPDGTRIAFIGIQRPVVPRNEIFFMNADGSALTQFTAELFANAAGLSWSRDGSTLAFMRYGPNPAVYYLPVAGGEAIKVADGEEPSFSLAGDRLMYSRSINGYKKVYWTGIRGGVEHQVLEGYNLGRAMFDVDGTGIVFSAMRPKAQIYLMDSKQQVRNLSNNDFSDSDPVVAGS